jgi:hypothetical protein
MCLFACSASKANTNPEWKSVYLQLIKDTLNEEVDARGDIFDYRIELYDMDNDGTPELQETYGRAAQPSLQYIWFLEDGVAKHIVFRYPPALEQSNAEYITGMYKNDKTGDLLAEKIYSHHQFGSYEYFVPSESRKIWNMVSAVGFRTPDIDQPAEYEHIDSEGARHNISGREYDEHQKQTLEGYTLLKGDSFNMREILPWSSESAKLMSNFFDSYDGFTSSVYKNL